ncbi:MAG: ATP synthase delta chain [uncultured Nocardioidaceae bacterium]|uniref:ATP synthase subunit delta n=1 Tax=uncultured Nocardioidaceae bacterium TaxID=253824 RepID=A0A6J4M9D9_9ACTN|nr:MAG: ATP synthase delta chain [uncultured Nocardioidaceae bacterium]
MRGSSARSQQTLLERVDTRVEDGADPEVLGDELFAVVEVLDAQPVLRRLLSDPASSEQAKRGMVNHLFGTGDKGLIRSLLSRDEGKVSGPTVELLGDAAALRWHSTRDLPDALERAGITAYLASAERAGQLDEVEDELFRFGRVVHGDPELRAAVGNRSLPVSQRRDLVDALLSGPALPATVALARQAAVGRHGSFETTLEDTGELAAQRRDRLVATVTSAIELGEAERNRLAEALGRYYGRQLHVNVVVDPRLMGGLTVQVGDDVIDGSVSGRLEDARRRISG